MRATEEDPSTRGVLWKVDVYVVSFFLLGIIAAKLLPEYKEWAVWGTGLLFVTVSAFLVGYYRSSYVLAGRALAPWRVVAMLMIALSPIAIAIVQFVLVGSATYALTVVAAFFAAGLLFVVAPLMLGRAFGRRRSTRRLSC